MRWLAARVNPFIRLQPSAESRRGVDRPAMPETVALPIPVPVAVPLGAAPTDPAEHSRVRKASSDHCAPAHRSRRVARTVCWLRRWALRRSVDDEMHARAPCAAARDGGGAADPGRAGAGRDARTGSIGRWISHLCARGAAGAMGARALRSLPAVWDRWDTGAWSHGPPARLGRLHHCMHVLAGGQRRRQVAGGDGGVSAWTHCTGVGARRWRAVGAKPTAKAMPPTAIWIGAVCSWRLWRRRLS